MIPRIIKEPNMIHLNMWDFEHYYINHGPYDDHVRIDLIEDDHLVPLIYALTGGNKMNKNHMLGIYYQIFDKITDSYVDCIGCIDHKDVKKVRRDFISALLTNKDNIMIDNVSYIEYVPKKSIEIPQDFIAKKEMLTDIQCNLSQIIKEKIDRDNEIGLMIVE